VNEVAEGLLLLDRGLDARLGIERTKEWRLEECALEHIRVAPQHFERPLFSFRALSALHLGRHVALHKVEFMEVFFLWVNGLAERREIRENSLILLLYILVEIHKQLQVLFYFLPALR